MGQIKTHWKLENELCCIIIEIWGNSIWWVHPNLLIIKFRALNIRKMARKN